MPYFFLKNRKLLQTLSSAAVVIGALRVKFSNLIVFLSYCSYQIFYTDEMLISMSEIVGLFLNSGF